MAWGHLLFFKILFIFGCAGSALWCAGFSLWGFSGRHRPSAGSALWCAASHCGASLGGTGLALGLRCGVQLLTVGLRLGAQAQRTWPPVVVVCRPSGPEAHATLPGWGSNPRSLRWQMGPQPLDHQGSPVF